MDGECVFCKIVAGEVPSTKVVDSERTYAFRDLNPVAPTHVLVIPKEHIVGADTIGPEHADVVAELFATARAVADADGIHESGYRLVFNVGRDTGQSVFHLHLHVIGGRKLGWPPG